jgi:hypothetical protein
MTCYTCKVTFEGQTCPVCGLWNGQKADTDSIKTKFCEKCICDTPHTRLNNCLVCKSKGMGV